MALPALDLLADHGFTLTLAGRPWARDLFSAYPWKVVSFSSSRIQALRNTKVEAGLLLTNSFSTALEFRLAGISAIGYARDARSWLLDKAVAVNAQRSHGRVLLPARSHHSRHLDRGAARLAITHRRARFTACAAIARRTRCRPEYVVLCPVAVGFHRGKLKAWGGFTQLNAELLAEGMQVVAMPGPNESDTVHQALPGAIVLPESDVATFSAVLAGARLVVANDSGAGHLAAAAGARLISVFGVTDPEKTRPWSTKATLVGSSNGWPSYQAVRSAVNSALRD